MPQFEIPVAAQLFPADIFYQGRWPLLVGVVLLSSVTALALKQTLVTQNSVLGAKNSS